MRRALVSSLVGAKQARQPLLRSSRQLRLAPAGKPSPTRQLPTARRFSLIAAHFRGILPETEDPQPPEPAEHHSPLTPADLTDKEYHELADQYLDRMLTTLEELQDSREDIDVEYSVGFQLPVSMARCRPANAILHTRPVS
jgi:hypothetical protein